MKRIALALCAFFLFSIVSFAQQDPSDAPASKEDVQRYLDVMHVQKMMNDTVAVMSKQMRQIFHDQLAKQPNMTPDILARADKMMEDEMKAIPVDDLLQAIAPIYQKYLTKGDIDALVAFYSTPRGQKLIAETPAMMGDAMQAASGVMKSMMSRSMQRVQDEVAQLQKENQDSAKKPAPVQN
ncbi:MAG TPA: DUF2059 domain-containing protein [Candidatus Micrarchaeia archaeon]|nr:DUF2059 domain-containing protein [Candidatus Micrarchaeia archaeon]